MEVEEVLCGLVNGGVEDGNLMEAVDHIQAALALLMIGTEELHALQQAGVGEFRGSNEDAEMTPGGFAG